MEDYPLGYIERVKSLRKACADEDAEKQNMHPVFDDAGGGKSLHPVFF
jgi:hypothetical protein